jgi:hypothetical protein
LDDGAIRVDFDSLLRLEFHGGRITSDAGLLAYRELDDALGLTDLAGAALAECRRGKNTRHWLIGLLRQAVFRRLAGYEDVNDAERLAHDPVTRAVVAWLTSEANLAAPSDLSGVWIAVSKSETHGAQEGSAYNGHSMIFRMGRGHGAARAVRESFDRYYDAAPDTTGTMLKHWHHSAEHCGSAASRWPSICAARQWWASTAVQPAVCRP